MTLLNAQGQDTDQRALVNILRHILSATPAGPSPVMQAIKKHKLVTFTPEDDQQLADWSMSQGRAAVLLRRILFHGPTLKMVASIVMNHWAEHTQAQAEDRLRELRTELKNVARSATAGLVLPTDPKQETKPQVLKVDGPEPPKKEVNLAALQEIRKDLAALRSAQDAGLELTYDESDIIRRAIEAGVEVPLIHKG